MRQDTRPNSHILVILQTTVTYVRNDIKRQYSKIKAGIEMSQKF